MATFDTSTLRKVLPILEKCYGFDISEAANELSQIYSTHFKENRIDKALKEQYYKDNRVDSLGYAISTNESIVVHTTEDFNAQLDSIKDLCLSITENKEIQNKAIFVLTFMSAIFNRNINNIYIDREFEYVKSDIARNTDVVRPDLLRLLIALNKQKHKYDTPIKICFKTDSPHIIRNKENWFSDMLNDYIKQKLGDITVEEAEKELDFFYSDEKGRKSDNPYLNYIINGTYNFINHISPSEKVTVVQCRFLLEYLKIIGLVKDSDNLSDINTLQSTVRSLLSNKYTPVEKHIKRNSAHSLPPYQRAVLD